MFPDSTRERSGSQTELVEEYELNMINNNSYNSNDEINRIEQQQQQQQHQKQQMEPSLFQAFYKCPVAVLVALFLYGLLVCLYGIWREDGLFEWLMFSGTDHVDQFHLVLCLLIKVFATIVLLPLYTLSQWSYLKTVVTDPGTVDQHFSIAALMDCQSSDNEDPNPNPNRNHNQEYMEDVDGSICIPQDMQIDRMLQLSNRYTPKTVNSKNKYRLCGKCMILKPDRAHHCRQCRRCILRFDHVSIYIYVYVQV